MTVATKSALTEVLDFMESEFTGDLDETARHAAEFAKAKGMASGPLWDEIGVQVLKQVYRVQRIATSKANVRKHSKVGEFTERCKEEIKAMWYNVGGSYYNLFDLTKPEVEKIAEYYSNQAASYNFECQFLKKLAGSLKKNQQVGDVYDMDGLRELRKKLTA